MKERVMRSRRFRIKLAILAVGTLWQGISLIGCPPVSQLLM